MLGPYLQIPLGPGGSTVNAETKSCDASDCPVYRALLCSVRRLQGLETLNPKP